ncbi:MAG: hypothetical protein AB1560_10335 [Pseudomonadota bacterium]
MTDATNRPATHLTLYLPGLFSMQENALAGADRPRVLETLLSRAETAGRRLPPGHEERLFALFDLAQPDNADLPVAAVTRMLDMGVIDSDFWLRADPVHLSFDRDRLILADAQKLDITPEQAARLVAEIMEVFSADGWLLKAPHPARWYLKPKRAPQLITAPLSQVVGRDIRGFLPRGPDEKPWQTIMNEIQILLHGSTVNVEREKEGKLPVNSLWFWGGGRLPRIAPVNWVGVWSHEPVSLSLAKLSGTPASGLPASYADWRRQTEATGEHLLVWEEAHDAMLYADVARWQEALKKLETDWMHPLLRDLKSGVLERVTFVTDIGEGFTLGSGQARRWWRRRRSLASYRGSGN